MTTLNVAAITDMGSHVYTEIIVRDDYTMNEIVSVIRSMGYVQFRLVDTMKAYVEV